MKNAKVLYPIFKKPLRLEEVSNGLWKTTVARSDAGTLEEEYMRGVDVFVRPPANARRAEAEALDRGDQSVKG